MESKFTNILSDRYESAVRYSEQKMPDSPLSFHRRTSRSDLIKHAVLRNQVQTAMAELIRGYEVTSGVSVIRIEYKPDQKRVMIDAVPAAR